MSEEEEELVTCGSCSFEVEFEDHCCGCGVTICEYCESSEYPGYCDTCGEELDE